MRRSIQERLLRECIRKLLSEDDGGDFGAAGYGLDMDTPMGVSMGGPSLWQTFVQPFTDVAQTAKAGIEAVAANARTALKVALEATLTTFIPILGSDYKRIFDEEHKQLEAIKEKYRDVFERTDAALATNDFKTLAFIYNPASYIGLQLAKKAPDAALQVLEVLAGENETLRSFVKKFTVKTTSGEGPKKQHGSTDVSIWKDSLDRSGRVVLEAGQEQSLGDQLAQALSDPKVQKAFAASQAIQSAREDAKKVTRSTLMKLIDHAREASAMVSIQQLKQKAPHLDLKALDQLKGNEKAQAEQALVKQAKAAAKNVYVKMLQSQIETAKKSGADANNLLLIAFNNALKKIQAM